MAKDRPRLSNKPSNAEKGGGKFGWPVGSIVEITEASYVEARDISEQYAKAEGRRPEDPTLRLVGVSDAFEDARPIALSCGKDAAPSRDGEYLEPTGASARAGGNDSAKYMIFLASLTDKEKHGRNTFDEDLLDNPGISSLVGLKFVVGSKKVSYDFQDGRQRKPNADTAMIAEEIVALPGKGGSKPKVAPAKRKADDDDDDRPARGKGKGKPPEEEEEFDASEATEAAIVGLLEDPKYRKGLPVGKLIPALFSAVKSDKNAEAIVEQANDEKWLGHRSRPWEVDDNVLTLPA